ALTIQKKWPKAIDAYKKALAIDPQNATNHGGFALLLATCPDPKLRDLRLAGEHARKAAGLQPQDVHAWQVLGWCQYRAGAWRESIEALDKACKLQAGTGDCGQWIVLALAHAKLAAQKGLTDKQREYHKAEARRRYEEANKQIDEWWRARPDHSVGQAIWD